ncbi:Uncharacterised protein [Mycobacteroides abscessus subsp. abscessus]|nr:Uncharacterised protein [Mycobacteroides abscessus subsp. abscessus]
MHPFAPEVGGRCCGRAETSLATLGLSVARCADCQGNPLRTAVHRCTVLTDTAVRCFSRHLNRECNGGNSERADLVENT